MGGALSWFYQVFGELDNWITGIWSELVLQERMHPIILGIACIIVLSVVLSCLCQLVSYLCCCCYRPRYPTYQYQPLHLNEKHNYAAIPSATQPPYNPNDPSTSKGYPPTMIV